MTPRARKLYILLAIITPVVVAEAWEHLANADIRESCSSVIDYVDNYLDAHGTYPDYDQMGDHWGNATHCGYARDGDGFMLSFRSRGWNRMGQYVYHSGNKRWMLD